MKWAEIEVRLGGPYRAVMQHPTGGSIGVPGPVFKPDFKLFQAFSSRSSPPPFTVPQPECPKTSLPAGC